MREDALSLKDHLKSGKGQGDKIHCAKPIRIGESICWVESCSSTNDLAKRLAEEGAEEGKVVVSEEQTKGRGRNGRKWFSVPRKGLYLSIILRPATLKISLLPLAFGVAVKEALDRALGLSVSLKWPNDILWRGQKLGGILMESSLSGNTIHFVIVGVGLNINHEREDFPGDLCTEATSLKLITGQEIDKAAFLQNLWNSCRLWYRYFLEDRRERIIEEFQESSAFPKGAGLDIETDTGPISGIFQGLDAEGGLILETSHGKKSFYSARINNVRNK